MFGYTGVDVVHPVKIEPQFTCLGRKRFECSNIGDVWKMQILESESEVMFSVIWTEASLSAGPVSLHAMEVDSSIDDNFVCSRVLALGDAWIQLTVMPGSRVRTNGLEGHLFLRYGGAAHVVQSDKSLRLDVSEGLLAFSEVVWQFGIFVPDLDGATAVFRGSVTCPLDSTGD